MRTKLPLVLVAATLLLGPVAGCSHQAKPNSTERTQRSTKFAVMVSNTLHFKAALMTAEEMQVLRNGYEFEIVAVGELAKSLAEDIALADDINKSEGLGVKVVVCENALAYFHVPKDKLDRRLRTEKNTWIYMWELQDRGFSILTV